jgi:hypothetical protein
VKFDSDELISGIAISNITSLFTICESVSVERLSVETAIRDGDFLISVLNSYFSFNRLNVNFNKLLRVVRNMTIFKLFYFYLLDFQIYLQSVEIHSANCVLGSEGG